MGIYSEYLIAVRSKQALDAERTKQLSRISTLRGGRDVLVIAADYRKAGLAPVSLDYSDLLPINDQLANLQGQDSVDVILETPGGSGEVAEDIVRLLRGRYKSMSVIVPGWAKSAGTIIAMAGDEILMEPASALGPIDAQMFWQGKSFSAHAFLKGLEEIKAEVITTGVLNRAYIPILQQISPGEIQSAQNAQDFAKKLVTYWLAGYKFKFWEKHSSNGNDVTQEEKEKRAEEIATELSDHGRWLTHGRSIKLDDLEKLRLKIIDYSLIPDLADAIRRYHTLMQMGFESGLYKIFETPSSRIDRGATQIGAQAPSGFAGGPNTALVDVNCASCGTHTRVQANLGAQVPLQPGCAPFPPDNKFRCPSCGAEADLSVLRQQIEAQSGMPIVS